MKTNTLNKIKAKHLSKIKGGGIEEVGILTATRIPKKRG